MIVIPINYDDLFQWETKEKENLCEFLFNKVYLFSANEVLEWEVWTTITNDISLFNIVNIFDLQ